MSTEKPPIEDANSNLENKETPDIIVPEESGGGQRTETPKPFLETQRADNLFSRLPEGAKQFASGLYEKVKINTVDRIKVAYNTKLLEWHDGRSVSIQSKLEGYQGETSELDDRLKALEDRLSSIKKGVGGVGEEVQKKANEEREKMEEKRDALKSKIEAQNSLLLERNRIKASYENTRKDIVEDVQNRVKEHLAPHEENLEQLRSNRDMLDSEINSFSERQESLQAGLKKLETALRESVFNFDQLHIKNEIKETKEELKMMDTSYKDRLKERRRIERNIARRDKKADNWRIQHNEFSRISNKKVMYPDVEPVVLEEADLERVELTSASTETSASESEEGSVEEEKTTFTPSYYIKEWNKYFGSELPINEETFFKVTGERNRNKELDLEQLGYLVTFYSNRLKDAGRKSITNSSRMKKNLAVMRRVMGRL